jgi:hypothetical protein
VGKYNRDIPKSKQRGGDEMIQERKTIRDIQVVREGSQASFVKKLRDVVRETQSMNLEVEILNPHLSIGAPPVGEYNFVATIIGREVKEYG